MIKLEHLSQIIAQLDKEFSCPRCQKTYGINRMVLRGVGADGSLVMGGICPHCEAKSHLAAQIEPSTAEGEAAKKAEKPRKPGAFRSRIPLTRSFDVCQIEDLKSEIKEFNGKDIKDLF